MSVHRFMMCAHTLDCLCTLFFFMATKIVAEIAIAENWIPPLNVLLTQTQLHIHIHATHTHSFTFKMQSHITHIALCAASACDDDTSRSKAYI